MKQKLLRMFWRWWDPERERREEHRKQVDFFYDLATEAFGRFAEALARNDQEGMDRARKEHRAAALRVKQECERRYEGRGTR